MKLVCIFVVLITQFMNSTENLNVPKTDEPISSELCYKPSVVGTPYLKTMELKFGRLTTTGLPFRKYSTPTSKIRQTFITAICECGKTKEYRLSHLKDGLILSCGCYGKEIRGKATITHGMTDKHPLYGIWGNIRTRCYNPKDVAYKNYGGRGIFMCDDWYKNYKSFYEWCINNGWQKGLEIDRRDNNLGYSPENCRFVTRKVNCRNRRNVLKVEDVLEIRRLYSTGNYYQTEIAKMYGVKHNTISAIVNKTNWKDI